MQRMEERPGQVGMAGGLIPARGVCKLATAWVTVLRMAISDWAMSVAPASNCRRPLLITSQAFMTSRVLTSGL